MACAASRRHVRLGAASCRGSMGAGRAGTSAARSDRVAGAACSHRATVGQHVVGSDVASSDRPIVCHGCGCRVVDPSVDRVVGSSFPAFACRPRGTLDRTRRSRNAATDRHTSRVRSERRRIRNAGDGHARSPSRYPAGKTRMAHSPKCSSRTRKAESAHCKTMTDSSLLDRRF